ncbi:MAG: AraC family transcriptional regulator [Planctomycetota bacterium]|jgi:AraC-like DNA-binding protein
MLHIEERTYRQTFYTSSSLSAESNISTNCVYLTGIGTFESLGNFRFEQIPSIYSIHVCTAGQGVIKYQNKETEFSQGDLFAFIPGHRIEYYDYPETPWKYLWITLEGNEAERMLAEAGITADNTHLANFTEQLETANILKDIELEFSRSNVTPFKSAAMAYSLFDCICRYTTPQASDRCRQVSALCRSIIDNQYMEDIGIEQISEKLEISRATLFRKFKKDYGLSPKEYMVKVRVDKALYLMKNTRYSLKQISKATGFNSSSYFCRILKKHTKLSPE